MLVVYLSNRYIRVVEGDSAGGNVNARSLHYAVDSAGCILNGVIMDGEGLSQIIKDLWEQHRLPVKGVHLVIDSSQFTTKVIQGPLLKPGQMMEFVAREFTDVERIANPVYGYFPLSGQSSKNKKTQTVFATMAPREYIAGYLELFRKLGIQVESAECAMGAALRLVGTLSQVKQATGIIQFVDDMMLINVLVIRGVYVYSSRNRLFSEPGTVEFAVELARSVSNILQFAKAQNISDKIKEVYIAGINKEELAVYADSVKRMDSEIQVDFLQAGESIKFSEITGGESHPSNFAIAVGGLLRTDAKTGLVSRMLTNPEQEAKKKKRRKVLIPLGIAAGVLVLAAGILGGYTLYLSRQLKEARAYNERADVVAACEEYDGLSQQLSTVNVLNASLVMLKDSALIYPRIDSTTESTVEACAAGLVTAQISSYDSETGILTFDTSAANAEQIHRFVDLLSQQEIFASVDYTGYTQDSEGQWNVKVNCTMADRQEDEDDAETN